MSNFSLYKTLSLQNKFQKQISKKTDITYEKQMSLNMYWVLSNIYTVFCVMASRILVLVAWIYFIGQWELTLAELFVIFSYIGWIYFPLWFIFRELRNSVRQMTEV
jgi:hypothetical protein